MMFLQLPSIKKNTKNTVHISDANKNCTISIKGVLYSLQNGLEPSLSSMMTCMGSQETVKTIVTMVTSRATRFLC